MDTAEMLAKEIYEYCGACPVERYDWKPPFDCGIKCKDGEEWKCWVKWAEEEDKEAE